MKLKTKLLLIAALVALAIPMVFTGTASAMYMEDGARPDGLGSWVSGNDMVCIVGLHMTGTLDLADGVTNSRDCVYRTTGTISSVPFDLRGMAPVDVTSSTMCGPLGTLTCGNSTNCTGTSAVTKGTLTWNATDAKCYDSAPCTVANFASGTYGGISFATANDGAKHALATSICVDNSGVGIPLTGLDRTAQMCAAKSGNWKQTSATAPSGFPGTFPTPNFGGACVAYTRQFKGVDASGTPLAFGSAGTTQAAGTGYCYMSLDFTHEPGSNYTNLTCPSSQVNTNSNAAYDWSFASSQCRYAKGIAGLVTTKFYKADGTAVTVGTYLDLSAFTTMGACLANGGTWSNWTFSAASISSIVGNDAYTYKRPLWDYTAQAPDADSGCLHCHHSQVEYNGPAEREKDSYQKTGHKNMLRKVTPGIPWAGPNGVVYTTDGTNTINFMTGGDPYGKITVGGVDHNLYYIYGDWMAPLPSVVYGTNAYGAAPGATNNYTCGACHTAGYSDGTVSPAVPGVQSIGTPGYAGVQPQASFPGIIIGATNPKWNLEGIQCARCHNAAVGPINATQIAASSFKSTAPHSGGMGALANGTGRNNLCFGCHQSPAKSWPSGATQYDPTLIPTGVSHGAAAGREFNGHVLGESFLNSVHGKYAGTNSNTANGGTMLNALGKYDLVDTNGTSEYTGIFKGYTCWQGPTSSSPAKTKDAAGHEFTSKADCEAAYGAGSWRADTGNALASSIPGTCTTCHDVHNSLFVASQEEAALRKTCADCHVNNLTTNATDAAAPAVSLAYLNHHTGANTPFDATKYPEGPCVVCHMATQAEANGNSVSMPVHLWRISHDPNYSTFPTTGQFYGGTCSLHTGPVANAPYIPVVYDSDTTSAKCTTTYGGVWTAQPKNLNANTAPDGAYNNAVWVDVQLACGQCHGGGTNPTDNPPIGAIPWESTATLAARANGIHNKGVTGPTVDLLITTSSYAPTGAKRGTNISVIDQVKNMGSGTAGASSTGIYLMTSCPAPSATPPPIGNQIGTRSVPAIVGGGMNSGTTVVTIPLTATTGTHYIVFYADWLNVVTESNELNNQVCKQITLL